MKLYLELNNVPDGIKPEVMDVTYKTQDGNFEQIRIYESEIRIITFPTDEEISQHNDFEGLFAFGAGWALEKIIGEEKPETLDEFAIRNKMCIKCQYDNTSIYGYPCNKCVKKSEFKLNI